MITDADQGRPVVVDRRRGALGELVLRRHGAHHEVIANGSFLMDTRDGRSERALVRAARDDAFQRRLRRRFTDVLVVEVPVARGPADVIYVAARPAHTG